MIKKKIIPNFRLKSQLEELNSLQHVIVLKPNLDDSQKKCTQDLALHITRVNKYYTYIINLLLLFYLL